MKILKRSKLANYEVQIRQWHESGCSYRDIASRLYQEYDITVSHNAVFSFLKVRYSASQKYDFFYSKLPEDIKASLLKQLNILWTHNSTAIEGNTLTLGETASILESGLTISGKSLREHEEVYGHSRAVELILALLEQDKIELDDIFNLHRCVMQKSAIDIMRPVGNWKKEYNGTTGIRDGKPVYMEFSSPSDTPVLMSRWLKEFNRKLNRAESHVKAINIYTWVHLTFVRIHPFFDGNGRIARLIANLPLLKCGHPPLLISPQSRIDYINTIWNYQNAVGVLNANGRLLAQHPFLRSFKYLIKKEWQATDELVAHARRQVANRKLKTLSC
ncbi:MAG: Fic family protein [Victivallaceae bacterium]|nr:Fic family protein [Victivallaceae bacterium]